MLPDRTSRQVLEFAGEEFSRRLAGVLELMAGIRPEVEPGSAVPEGSDFGPGLLWWEQPLSLAPGALFWVGCDGSAWADIGGSILRASGIDEAEDSEKQNTYFEVLTQSLSGVAQALGSKLGREVNCEPGRVAAAGPNGAGILAVRIQSSVGRQHHLLLQMSSAAAEAIAAAVLPEPGPGTPVAEPNPAPPSRTLDLLMEVEMPVSVSFGRAHLPLKDVLKLATGSIVELNKTVSEPVEIIVNNCVIARGEVVVVEGNYGVRIQQIISRQERLRTLK